MASTKISPLGFGAEEILRLVEASQGTVSAYWPLVTAEHESGSMTWTEPVQDASTVAQLHVKLTPRGSKAAYFEASEEFGCEVPRLEIPVDVEFELENGAGTLSTQICGHSACAELRAGRARRRARCVEAPG